MNMMERTMRSYCMVRFVSLLLIGTFIAGCTQANNSEVTTSQMSALSTPKDQLPLIPDDIIRESGIDTVYADADGNGVADRIERCGSAAICIYLKDTAGQESSPRTYKNADWARVSIERVEDVNDIPGNEVIVKTVKPDGGFGCICIITAKDNSVVSYTDPAWFSVTIDSIADTDGVPGTEIILSVTNPKGDFHCICVVHPNSESHVAIAAYSNAKWKYVFVRWQDDTDGSPGQELILEVRDGQNNLVCVCVVHDRNSTMTAYQDGAWGSSLEINSIADTDGHPGAEIVLVIQEPTTAGVGIIHDRTKEVNVYRFTSELLVETVSNRDAQPGSEICVRVSASHEYYVIRDRAKVQEAIETCV